LSVDPLEQITRDESEHRGRLLRRARLLADARADSIAGHRETIRLLTIVLALAPFTQATSAPNGWPGRPIEPTPPHLRATIPRPRRPEPGRRR